MRVRNAETFVMDRMEAQLQRAGEMARTMASPELNPGGVGAMAGMAAGTLLAAGLTLAGMGKVWGWHAGVLGLALNVSVGILVSAVMQVLPLNSSTKSTA